MIKWKQKREIGCFLFLRAMHIDRTSLNKKRLVNHETGAKMQQTWVQTKTACSTTLCWSSETKSISTFLLVNDQQIDNKNITMLSLLDDHSRTKGFHYKRRVWVGSSYPWIHYHLDDRNGCWLKTKILRLIIHKSMLQILIFNKTLATVRPCKSCTTNSHSTSRDELHGFYVAVNTIWW